MRPRRNIGTLGESGRCLREPEEDIAVGQVAGGKSRNSSRENWIEQRGQI